MEPARGHAPYACKTFVQTGKFWVDHDADASRLSPDKRWLVLQSRTRAGEGTGYFDVFNVATGQKLVTIRASFRHAFPDSRMEKTFWLTSKYFFIPVGEYMDGFVICRFDSTN